MLVSQLWAYADAFWCVMQDTAYQDNVIDAVVLVLLSMAGPDHSSSVKTARHSQPKSVSTVPRL